MRKHKLLPMLCFMLLLCCIAGTCFAGELTGIGQGRNGEITVKVTVENDIPVAVEVLSHSETEGICEAAIEQIPAAIVAAGNTNVDAVAGATLTSNGIIEAVNNALGQTTETDEETSSMPHKDPVTPRIITLDNGVQVQKTPDAGLYFGWFAGDEYTGFNTTYLNADNRGCSACHNLEDCLKAIDHCVYKGAYPADDMPLQNCVACHSNSYSGLGLQQLIHSLHLGSTSFTGMAGTCESCHYIDSEGNYLRWDYVKYDVMYGITDLSADTVDASVTWDQDKLTEEENMFTVSWGKKSNVFDFGYSHDYAEAFRTEDYRNTYTVKFYGDMDNPCELTIQEMIDLFGTETQTVCGQCSINGIGGSLIYQCEVTGIPLEKMLDYLGVHEDANILTPNTVDIYPICVPLAEAINQKALLVVEMNGHELSNAQGFPIALWFNNYTCGLYARTLSEINICAGDLATTYECYGPFVDDATGYRIDMPNIGVLTATSGQIWSLGETVHLEGYADAFDEPITKIEFSFDRGASWKEVQTENTDSTRWVYWYMDINGLEKGAYVLRLRATSLTADGTERVNEELPTFLINVK